MLWKTCSKWKDKNLWISKVKGSHRRLWLYCTLFHFITCLCICWYLFINGVNTHSPHPCNYPTNSAAEKLVLRSRQFVDVRKDDGFAALHLAALNGHRQVAETLITLGQASVDITNNKKQTPLLLAVSQVCMVQPCLVVILPLSQLSLFGLKVPSRLVYSYLVGRYVNKGLLMIIVKNLETYFWEY